MIPGMDSSKLGEVDLDGKELSHTEAIIKSMTAKERTKPEIINASRKKRIANGSGTTIQEVNKLLSGFEQSKKMMKQFAGMGKGMKKGKKFPFF